MQSPKCPHDIISLTGSGIETGRVEYNLYVGTTPEPETELLNFESQGVVLGEFFCPECSVKLFDNMKDARAFLIAAYEEEQRKMFGDGEDEKTE